MPPINMIVIPIRDGSAPPVRTLKKFTTKYYPTNLMGNILVSENYPTNLMGNILVSENYPTILMGNILVSET